MAVSSRYSRGIVYGVAIAPLLVTLGFYFIEHVPEREEYFLNLRFRTLAVIGKQIETKLESVSSGLTYGKSIGKIPQSRPMTGASLISFEEYVSRTFPGLRQADVPAGTAKARALEIDPDIDFDLVKSGDRIRFRVNKQETPWEDSLTRLIRPFTEDASFDDILLARKDGVVLFQRSNATPKVKDVANILKKQEAKEGSGLEGFHRLASEGTGNDTDLLRQVNLDGSEFHFFAEPLTIEVPRSQESKPKDLLLCGLVRSQRIRQESMHVPPKYLLWIIVPLVACLLSGPFLKLMLMRRTGRFETRDLPLLALFSCLAMAMLTVVLLAYQQYDLNRERMGKELAGLAGKLDRQLQANFRKGRQLLQEVDRYASAGGAAPSKAKAGNRVRLWLDEELLGKVPDLAASEFEFVFWTAGDGTQVEKWTPLETNTPFYPQKGSEHFDLAVKGQYWHDPAEPWTPFTSELLISPTTSAPISVITIPSARQRYISLVATPRPLLSPVIPPETGYAIVKADGAVLYHSSRERILNENLFRETEESQELANAVATQTERWIWATYRGSDVMFYVRPIRTISGTPWTIVAFREMEPWQSFGWQVPLDVLVVYLMLWIGPGLIWLAVLLRFKFRYNYRWSRCRIEVLRYFWPRREASANYVTVVRIESALLVAFAAVLVWFSARPDNTTGMALLLATFLVPFVAIATWAWQLRHPSEQRRRKRWRTWYVAALCLSMVIASVLPVTTFFHLGLYLENELYLKHWQRALADRVVNHRSAAESEIRQSENMAPRTMEIALKLALPAPKTGFCDDERLYEALYATSVTCGGSLLPNPADPWWIRILRFFRTQAPGGLEEESGAQIARERARPAAGGPAFRAAASGGFPAVHSEPGTLPTPLRQASWWVWLVLLLIAGCVWIWNAASRLFLFDFYEIPLRNLKALPAAQDLNHAILVLGLPRSGKDGAVKVYVGQRVERIDLKVEKMDGAWLEENLKRLDAWPEPQAAPAAAMAATATGGFPVTGAPEAGSDAQKAPEWVHITNLDAALHEKERRDMVLKLIDALLRSPHKPRLVVTSVVDPLFHLDSIFPDQRKEVDRDALPETEFGRWAHVLLHFERVTADDELSTPAWAEKKWGKRLWNEAHHHPWLLRIANMIADGITHPERRDRGVPSDGELIEELHEKALALYELFWAACTRPEKLMLVQLAQTGLVNPLGKDTLHELIRKRLVLMNPYPTIMNESFTRFLNTAANAKQIEAWEKEAGESRWPVVRNVLTIVVVFALAMIGISQNHALQAFSALLTAVAGALGGSFKLADLVSKRLGKRAAGEAG